MASTIAKPSPAVVANTGYRSWTVLTITPPSAQVIVATYGSRPRVNRVMATAVPTARAKIAAYPTMAAGVVIGRPQLEKDGIGALPGRTSIYRTLVRHGLMEAEQRRRRRADYRR